MSILVPSEKKIMTNENLKVKLLKIASLLSDEDKSEEALEEVVALIEEVEGQ
jgi:hypothetical protein